MLSLEKILDQGLDNALERVKREITKDPGNAEAQVDLFQLMCLAGDWTRATQRLDAIETIRKSALFAVTYRRAIRCEVFRGQVFAGERTPLVFGEPPEWVGWLVAGLACLTKEEVQQADELRRQAFEAATVSSGTVTWATGPPAAGPSEDEPQPTDTAHFDWMADADSRLGPLFEALIEGRYFWIPISAVKQVVFRPPSSLCDLVWMRATFTWTNGGESSGLVPTRYPGSEASDNPDIRLGRRTEWIHRGGEIYVGLGQRMVTSNVDDFAVMDLRQIDFDGPVSEPEA